MPKDTSSETSSFKIGLAPHVRAGHDAAQAAAKVIMKAGLDHDDTSLAINVAIKLLDTGWNREG